MAAQQYIASLVPKMRSLRQPIIAEVGSLQAGIDLENRTQIMTSMTEDMSEAVRAFVEKRPPDFGDR